MYISISDILYISSISSISGDSRISGKSGGKSSICYVYQICVGLDEQVPRHIPLLYDGHLCLPKPTLEVIKCSTARPPSPIV